MSLSNLIEYRLKPYEPTWRPVGESPLILGCQIAKKSRFFVFNEPAWGVMGKYKDKMLEQNPTDNRRPDKRK